MKQIDLYYSRVCDLCTKAIEFLHSRGVTFTDSKNTREMYRRCGEEVELVPQIFIGDRYIGGWRKLEPLIGSDEIDGLL